jgi:hypothetical protein
MRGVDSAVAYVSSLKICRSLNSDFSQRTGENGATEPVADSDIGSQDPHAVSAQNAETSVGRPITFNTFSLSGLTSLDCEDSLPAAATMLELQGSLRQAQGRLSDSGCSLRFALRTTLAQDDNPALAKSARNGHPRL